MHRLGEGGPGHSCAVAYSGLLLTCISAWVERMAGGLSEVKQQRVGEAVLDPAIPALWPDSLVCAELRK